MFVCYGNVCRSPMAEGFANCYGSDVLKAESCGLAPIPTVPRSMILAMREKNIDTSRHISRRYLPAMGAAADIVVNMSEYRLPGAAPRRLLEWKVGDPMGKPIEEFRKTRDLLEEKVMSLILAIRRGAFK